ncbi:SulP family inorganic anion transporter [Xanthomonas citri pv. mangiferaeindicae]|uniref:SulP family inorganic anion transporter n=1 Tax=Xanthomonas citri TaxID=346 RepID=UPI0002552CF0|nr:SulP family inorganic anion transporter [Xanthomonas citri]OOW52545.1 sulfate transporter [Xanthomonas campestris pv. centellae]UDB87579.1 SulP family inorganic anion transporter [Xanthomonas citri pv. mangiferaeindicae]UDI79988.1 sulfate transporter [Xanthomonas citri pv. mangiferaeindicae]CCG38827.1 antisigma-factor antagonist STAS [Xanthomonas citri pv. mangiferaeindicae LMG 941]
MSLLRAELAQWRASPARELMAGAVATFALIPEVIAFAFVAGVDPQVGLFASFVIGIVIAFCGGRPAMISAAAGSVALVAAPLVAAHGLPYLLAAGLLAGVVQILFGVLRLGVLMRFVSSSVRTGFVNALAVLIFAAQLPHLLGANPTTWVMLGAGLAIIYGLPRLRLPGLSAIPSPLLCILLLSVAGTALHLPLKTVADLGKLPNALPFLQWPAVPLTLETLRIIALPALAIAMVGLLESMMTARVVDELTDTPSNKNRECTGLGIANAAASLFGGIAGCGMIGQTVGNVKYGGRGRLSTLFAGVFLLILMVLLKPWVSQVPVVALVAIMVMVSAETFDWRSLRTVVTHPRTSSVVMLTTVAVTLFTHNLAAGVAVGVLLSGVFFTFKVAGLLQIAHHDGADGVRTYSVRGQVFFASADVFIDAFDAREVPGRAVVIDVGRAHFWDITAVAALDKVVQRFRHHGLDVQVKGLNAGSRRLMQRHALGEDALESALP